MAAYDPHPADEPRNRSCRRRIPGDFPEAIALVFRKFGECRSARLHRQTELSLTQARYEAGLARRQYDTVEPDNRLVPAELERRWNDRLVEVHSIEKQLTALGRKWRGGQPRSAPG